MKKKRYCVMCAGENILDFGFREKQSVCPHCGAILRYKRSLFGRERISAHRPMNEDDNTVVTVQMKRKGAMSNARI